MFEFNKPQYRDVSLAIEYGEAIRLIDTTTKP